MADRSRLFWLALRRKFNVARGRVLVWPLAGLIYWPARGERLVIAPQELRTAHPTRPNEIYGGRVAVPRKSVVCDRRPPFEAGPPPRGRGQKLPRGRWLRPPPSPHSTITP